VQTDFLEFLQRPDSRQDTVWKALQRFNEFVESQKDMCEEENTKEELHQRAEDLADQMASISDEKKEEALAEKDKVENSLWIESMMERFTLQVQDAMQAELDKFVQVNSLVNDYYADLDAKPIDDTAGVRPSDIYREVLDGGELALVEVGPEERKAEGIDK